MKKKPNFFIKIIPKIDFPSSERQILKWWYESGVVDSYLKRNRGAPRRFRFLDGPITANNPMGVHHAHGRTVKDCFQRYKNMQGYQQRFQNGFDCQGLWVEVEEEKERGFYSKKDIEAFGLAAFSQACRARVEKFAAIQTEQSKRLGMFMDWDNSYYTMSDTNNVYIWYFLKICHQKGWLYQGIDSMPWCIRCGTAISQHELSDEGYRDVEHDSVFVKFPLTMSNSSLLIWTTTPWTLLANVAVAVKPDLAYLEVETGSDRLIVAKPRIGVIQKKYRVIQEWRGQDLLGKNYHGPFDDLPRPGGVNHRVIAWNEVSEAEGTGLVHIAPGAGHEDFQLSKIQQLDQIEALDEFGNYQDGFGAYTGRNVREVPALIFADLENKGLLYRKERIIHSYPFCWRCKEELVFRTTSEWFIRVAELRPRLKKAADLVNWIPKYTHKRMDDWLDNMGDWPISRKRYWGLALPIYPCYCGEVTVVGSKKELRERAVDPQKVDQLPELHRPWIDEIKINCPACHAEISRVPDVGDCWLDAGIVPFSTVKYLEDRQYWQEWYPFDFITEYIAQTKLWFYATLFMSVVLEDRAPWQNVLASGFIVDEHGQTMHKSKGNAIWIDEAVEKMGADVMRWIYLSKDLSGNLRFGFKIGDEIRRRFVMILWNTHVFLMTYAGLDHWKLDQKPCLSSAKLTLLDCWIVSRLNRTIQETTQAMESYDPPGGAKAINHFVQDLSTWYLRRSRGRVDPVNGEAKDKDAFYQTMHHVLLNLSILLAPYLPFISEIIFQNLRQKTDPESVHLCDWPELDEGLIDRGLEAEMVVIRQAAEIGHAERQKKHLKVRQPLIAGRINLPDVELVKNQELVDLLTEELNIKRIELVTGETGADLDCQITTELRMEGLAREIFRQLQVLRKSAGCCRDERLKAVVIPGQNLNQHWQTWVKEKVLADVIETGRDAKIERYHR